MHCVQRGKNHTVLPRHSPEHQPIPAKCDCINLIWSWSWLTKTRGCPNSNAGMRALKMLPVKRSLLLRNINGVRLRSFQDWRKHGMPSWVLHEHEEICLLSPVDLLIHIWMWAAILHHEVHLKQTPSRLPDNSLQSCVKMKVTLSSPELQTLCAEVQEQKSH